MYKTHFEGLLKATCGPSYTACFEKTPNSTDQGLVDILICGERSLSNQVANILSQAELFLEHPYWKPEGLSYENPHYLELPNRPCPVGDGLVETLDDVRSLNQMPSHVLEPGKFVDRFSYYDYLNNYRQASIDNGIAAKLMR